LEEELKEIYREAERTGATEQEAALLIRLREFGKMFSELPGITDVDLTTVNQCITTLTRVVATRVTERDHPEGWFFSKEEGEERGI
jgi:hypothetical protein